MFKKLQGLAVLAAALFLSACAAVSPREQEPERMTSDFMVIVYPGVDKNYNPDTKLTLEEDKALGQLNEYCTKQTERLSGKLKEMTKQGITYGLLEGLLGGWAARAVFGPAVRFSDYFRYIGGTAAGGGLASGAITYDMAKSITHGYCMTLMVYKADELEGKLRRVGVVPLYTGSAKLPPVGSDPAPKFERSGREGYMTMPMPPR